MPTTRDTVLAASSSRLARAWMRRVRHGLAAILWTIMTVATTTSCTSCDSAPKPPRLNVANLPASQPVAALSAEDAHTLCVQWEQLNSDELARVDMRIGCMEEALQEGEGDVAACEAAFAACMNVDEDLPSAPLDPESDCEEVGTSDLSGCAFSVTQLAPCVDATVAAYDRMAKSADCATYVPRGGLTALTEDLRAAATGAGNPVCDGVTWTCDDGELRGFESWMTFGDD